MIENVQYFSNDYEILNSKYYIFEICNIKDGNENSELSFLFNFTNTSKINIIEDKIEITVLSPQIIFLLNNISNEGIGEIFILISQINYFKSKNKIF